MKLKNYKIKASILTMIAIVLANGLVYAQTKVYTQQESFTTQSEIVESPKIEVAKSVPIKNDGYELPFFEDFSTGSFESNEWSTTGENWRITTQNGNDAPAAEFTCDSAITNYSQSLESYFLNGTNVTDENIKMEFDLKHTLDEATMTEFLTVEIHNGEAWMQVAQYTNVQSTNWKTKYLDITNHAKDKVFRVRFTANGDSTLNILNWMVDNVHIYAACEGPKNLKVYDKFGTGMILEWDAPNTPDPGPSAWLAWDNGVNAANGIGLSAGGTFSVASRFTPLQLVPYVGTTLTKVKFFPLAATGSTFVVKVWTGSDASQLLSSQTVTFTSNVWNEIVLNTPVAVTGTTELWFGYTVTHPANINPAGVDEGPAKAGYGDMITTDGTTWEAMSSFGPNFNINWNLQGFVETLDGVSSTLNPIADNVTYGNDVELTIRQVGNVNNPFASVNKAEQGIKEFVRYNIYRFDSLVATTSETSYIDDYDFSNDVGYCYSVIAVYDECESMEDQVCQIWTSMNEVAVASVVNIYPNPSSSDINIELANNISRLVVCNYIGQVVFEQVVTNEANIKLNVREYEAGVYLVKFTTYSGESFSKKLIVTK